MDKPNNNYVKPTIKRTINLREDQWLYLCDLKMRSGESINHWLRQAIKLLMESNKK